MRYKKIDCKVKIFKAFFPVYHHVLRGKGDAGIPSGNEKCLAIRRQKANLQFAGEV